MQTSSTSRWLPFVSLALVVTATLGLLDASYITYEKMSGQIPPCTSAFKCGAVLESPWSNLGPLPLSVYGMVFYSVVLVVASAHFLGVTHIKIGRVRWHIQDILLALGAFGLGFSAYLIFIMGVVLQAWCLYCLLSATACFTNAVLSFGLWRLKQDSCHECGPARVQLAGVLYQTLLKPFFFLFDPELVHTRMILLGQHLGKSSAGRALLSWWFGKPSADLVVARDGLVFPGPVGLAAGFDYNGQLTQTLPGLGFGFGTVGTVTWQPCEGNPTPRLGRLPKSQALLVHKGFRNQGAKVIAHRLQRQVFEIPVGISIGSTNQVYKNLADQLADMVKSFTYWESVPVKHAYYELNISCPNLKGAQTLATPANLRQTIAALTPLHIKRPVYLKMPVDLSDRDALALLAIAAKAKWLKGVILGNLTKDKTNPAVDPADRAIWQAKPGNLSGKPTWLRSNHLVELTRQHYPTRFTIIGLGGIFSAEDARIKLQKGADLVQLITGMSYQGPQLVAEINHSLATRPLKKRRGR